MYVVDEKFHKAAKSPIGWKNCKLRQQFKWIITRAGLVAWERVFHNLCSSCETDLMKRHPMPTVAAWMGHSIEVAVKHYTQITADEFTSAAEYRSPIVAAQAVQKAVHPATFCVTLHPTKAALELQGQTAPCNSAQQLKRRARDSNSQPIARHDISSVAANHSLTPRSYSVTLCTNRTCVHLLGFELGFDYTTVTF